MKAILIHAVLSIFAGLFLCHELSAQNYYAIRSDGAVPKGYLLDKVYSTDKDILLNQPANNSMSGLGVVPFSFYFYGKPYSTYRVSENGYLSFNTANTNAEVPDTNLPDNSIVAFGADFKLQVLPAPNEGIGTQVFSYTVGKAPNRSHIVQYYGLSLASDPLDKPINNASIYAFAIVLHEGQQGRFDLVYSPYGDKNKTGSIGCASDSGDYQYLKGDSLHLLPFQYSFSPSDFIVYQFYRGIQPQYDLKINEINLQSMYPVNHVVNFSGKLSNLGTAHIESFYLNYSVNEIDTVSYLMDMQNLKPSGLGNAVFSHPVSWLGGAAGSLNQVKFWLSGLNGKPDEVPENSLLSKTVLRTANTASAMRNILMEEGTGAWCGYCPDAHLIIADAVKKHGSRVIPVAYHYDDSMSNPDADQFLSNYISSYPDAMLDRKVFLGSNSTWPGAIDARLGAKVPVEISIANKTFDPLSRKIAYTVKVRFTDYWYGQLNIGSMVTENRVRGNESPNLWSQNNYYSKFNNGGAGGSAHRLYNEPVYMHGYLHHNVHKASPGGVWGVSGKIPEYVLPDAEYTCDFTYTLPEPAFVRYTKEYYSDYCSTADRPGENEGRNIPAFIQLIGYVSVSDSDVFNRPVVNAVGEPLWNLTGLLRPSESVSGMHIYPNPSAGLVQVQLKLQGPARLSVYNSSMQMILSKDLFNTGRTESAESLDLSHLPAGIYTLELQQAESRIFKRFSLIH